MKESIKLTPPQIDKGRNSSIELLKIFAILSITTSHCVQSLAFASPYYNVTEYLLDLSLSTTSPWHFFLSLLMYAGLFGNAIFIVSSFYFLQKSDYASKRKVFHFALDIWVVSVIFLLATLIIKGGGLDKGLIICQLFPNYFCTNWFMTIWMILYLIHPILNRLMDTLGKRWHLRAVLLLLTFYCVLGTVFSGNLFSSLIIVWICFYLMVGYMTRYYPDFGKKIKMNVLLIVVPLTVHVLFILLLDIIALKTGHLEGKLLRFRNDCNPLFFFMAVGLFNLFSSKFFYSKIINKIAACSLLVYIIHENQLLRYVFRPTWWDYIYNSFGYERVVMWVAGMSLLLFLVSLSLSLFYRNTIQKLTTKVGDLLFDYVSARWISIENVV